jgi:hypothetical protein
MSSWALLAVLALSCGHALAQGSTDEEAAGDHRPVEVIAESRIAVGDQGMLALYVSLDWERPLPGVTRAVLILHGRPRNADVYFRSAQMAEAAAGEAGRSAILIAPQFLEDIDVDAFHLPSDTLHWSQEAWEGGEPALGPSHASSFDALDAILARLADGGCFPT